MPRTSLIAESDRLDPWGFGTTAADEPTVVLDAAGLDDDLTGLEAFDTGPDAAAVAVGELGAPIVDVPRAAVGVRPLWAVPRRAGAVLALSVLVVFGQVFYIGLSFGEAVGASPAPTGVVVLSSHPAGAGVVIDGRAQGVTPLVAAVPVGRHQVQVNGADGAVQTLEANVSATARWTRHVVLTPAVAAAALRIDTVAPGAAVWLDGHPAGRTPVVLSDMSAGDHAVRIQFATGGVVDRRVVLAGGETVSLVFTGPAARAVVPAGPASGWVRVQSAFDVQVFESGQVVGASASERILVTAGSHVFELVNAALGYRASRKVVVAAGRTEALVVDTPRTAVHVNAQPWAEILVDGRLLGETPLANLMLPIGTHQFLLRHPDLGERTQPVTVRLNSPNRVTADLRREP